MTGNWFIFVVWFVLVGLGRGQDDFCYYGHTPIPKSLYSHMIGWSCFEHVGYNALDSEMYACVSDEGFKVPCLRNGNRYLDFSSQISRKRLLEVSIKEEELTKCFQKNSPCRINPTPNSISRVWVPASVCDTEPRNKFHIAMLSISFIMGIPAFMFLIYFSWTDQKDITLLLHRNLICAVTFRSLMTLLIQTEIILPHSEGSTLINREGIPALATFETLTLDLVLGFWMVQTMALWKIITNEHGIPLRVNIYTYASIGLSLSFTLIWVIVMASTQDLENWIGVRSWPQWLNEPLRIIFLVFQIGLILYSAKKIFWDAKSPLEKHEPKSSRRIRIETIYVLILTPIFILQFCLNAGSPNGTECEEAFFYVFFFIDGIQGALVCLFFFYINSEIKKRFEKLFGLDVKEAEPARPIRTLDSLRDRSGSELNDIVYSSVLDPERHAKTLQVYQKRNLIPTPSVTVVEGEEFVACADRKISTATVFYDAVSLEEEPQPIPRMVPLAFMNMQLQSKIVSEPNTPILESKYSSIGQSLSSASSNSSSLNRQPSLVRNISTEAVRSSMPEDLKVTPRIMLTQPTLDRSSLEDTPEYSDDVKPKRICLNPKNFKLEANLPSEGDEEEFEPKLRPIMITGVGVFDFRATVPNTTQGEIPGKQMLRISQDSSIQYSSSESDTSSTKEAKGRLGDELDKILENFKSPETKPYFYQDEDSINSFDLEESGHVERDTSSSSDSDSNREYSDHEKVPEKTKNDELPSEYSKGGDNSRGHVVFPQSAGTNYDILDKQNSETKTPDHEYSQKIKEFDQNSSNSDSSVYSEDERVPDSILNLLLSKKPGKSDTPSEYSNSREEEPEKPKGNLSEYSTGRPPNSSEIQNTPHKTEPSKNYSEYSGGHDDGTGRAVFRQSSETNNDILDERNSKTKKPDHKHSQKSKEFDRSSSSSDSSVYSEDERVPDSILNLLLSKKPEKFDTPSEYSNSQAGKPVSLEETKGDPSEYSTLKQPNSPGIQNTPHKTEPSSSHSEYSGHKTTKNFQHSPENRKPEPDFDDIPLPNTPENLRDSSSEHSEAGHSPITSGDRVRTTKPEPVNPHAQTLPRCSEPVAKPRPLSLTDERRTKFSNMFSKHRDKILSSRSEDAEDGKRTLRKFPGFDNLSISDVFEKGSSTPSTITANNSDEEWLPQDVHFADN